MKESELHLFAGLGTVVISALVVAPTMLLTGRGEAQPDINLAEMESIEAELAMKSEEAPKQPQKEKTQPDPIIEEKVGGDPLAKATVCKADSECPPGQVCRKGACVPDPTNKKPEPDVPLSERFKKSTTDDSETGDTKLPQIGSFDGSEHGWATETKGDPFFIDLVKDLRQGWEYPTISSDEGTPVGCLRLEPSGKILDTKFLEKSNNAELDDSVERAMSTFMKRRNENPVEVPTHLLRAATTRWVCIRFKPKA